MSPRKLTDRDKQEILQLYRNPEETTSTLAIRYSVSSSTVSRFLKSSLSQEEYDELIKQKRQSRSANRAHKQVADVAIESEVPQENVSSKVETPIPPVSPVLKTQQNVINKSKSDRVRPSPEPIVLKERKDSFEEDEEEDEIDEVNVITLQEMLGEDLEDIEEDEDDLEYPEEDWEATEGEVDYPHTPTKNTLVQIMPLSEASFPQTCYLVIDRSSELITRPLKEFADLGNIPVEEVGQETLPVFDNHRVARRFSHRSQRVIKVPDGQMIQKTSIYLQAKGITRVLIDGQVYSLSSLELA
ncbi:MAG: hypothetical protein QNJ54_03535 [Prochloraceae cyanobacterium]|nr:hypothetical protein [Prochloraceae cyanobacterium]